MKKFICFLSLLFAMTSSTALASHTAFRAGSGQSTTSLTDAPNVAMATAVNEDATATLTVSERITDAADLKEGGLYLIRNVGNSDRRGYLYEANNSLHVTTGDDAYNQTQTTLPINYLFRVTGNGADGFTFISYADESVTSARVATGNFTLLEKSGAEAGVWNVKTPNSYLNVEVGYPVEYWVESDANGKWEFYPAECAVNVVEMTYQTVYGSEILGSNTLRVAEGESFPQATQVPVYATISGFPTGTAQAGTYNLQVTPNYPFMTSESTDDAHWYVAKIRDNDAQSVAYDGNAAIKTQGLPLSSYDQDFNNYLWSFYQVEGKFWHVKVFNKGAGKYLVSSTNNNSAATLGDETAATVYKIVKNGNGFNLQIENNVNANLNDVNGGLGTWNYSASITDAGSRFTIYDPLTAAGFDYIFPNLRSSAPDYVGNPSLPQALQDAYAAYVNQTSAADMAEGYNQFSGFADLPIRTFDTNLIYRIKNYCRDLSRDNQNHPGEGAYMRFNTDTNPDASIDCKSLSHATADALWMFEGNETDGYKIFNLNAQKYIGKTSTTGNSLYPLLVDEAEAGIYALANTDKQNQFTLTCTNTTGNFYKQLHVSGYGVMNYGTGTGTDSPSSWNLEIASSLECGLNAAADGASYATAYYPFAVAVTGETKAYALAQKDGDETVLQATEVAEGKVPANTGVLLKNDAAETTAVLNILTEAPAAVTTALTGTTTAQEITDATEYYVFGNGDAGVGFYHPAATTLKANKAYLYAPASQAQAFTLSFGDTTTGIDGTEISTETTNNAPYYDLSGRRVLRPAKGLYIHGGKKVYIK